MILLKFHIFLELLKLFPLNLKKYTFDGSVDLIVLDY